MMDFRRFLRKFTYKSPLQLLPDLGQSCFYVRSCSQVKILRFLAATLYLAGPNSAIILYNRTLSSAICGIMCDGCGTFVDFLGEFTCKSHYDLGHKLENRYLAPFPTVRCNVGNYWMQIHDQPSGFGSYFLPARGSIQLLGSRMNTSC